MGRSHKKVQPTQQTSRHPPFVITLISIGTVGLHIETVLLCVSYHKVINRHKDSNNHSLSIVL